MPVIITINKPRLKKRRELPETLRLDAGSTPAASTILSNHFKNIIQLKLTSKTPLKGRGISEPKRKAVDTL